MRGWQAVVLGAVVLALSGGAAPVLAAEAAKKPKPVHLVIGLDLSKSNPLVADDAYARKVAERLAPLVARLEPRSLVTLRTFGAYDPTANNLRLDRVISSKNPKEEVARVVEGIVAGVPTLVANGKLNMQMTTNIVPFLENMAEVVDCKAHRVEIYLVTDGLEDSEYARLADQRSALPAPAEKLFARCQKLEILGLGLGGKSPGLTNHLRAQWSGWAKAAGFKEFHGLNDW